MAADQPIQGAHLVITGITQLLVHNRQLASTFNPYAQQMAKITGKRVKTEKDRRDLARIEFEGSLYVDPMNPGLGPVIPKHMIIRCLGAGAVAIRQRTAVERAVSDPDTALFVKLVYKGPRTAEALWGNGLEDLENGIKQSPFVDFRSVGMQGGKSVDRCRPIFPIGWKCEIDLAVDTQSLDWDMFLRVVDIAGRQAGIGDYRRGGYGRFTTKVTKVSIEKLIGVGVG